MEGNEAITAAPEVADASAGLGVEPGATGADQAIDDILGLGPEPGAETAEATGEAAETQPEAVEAELPLESAPEWLKPLFTNTDPNIAAQAKSVWNRIQAYSQLGSVAQARALKEAVEAAGGVEALRSLQSKSQEIDAVDEAFYSADPERQAEVLGSLYRDDPEAFRSSFQVSADLIKSNEPEAYQQFAQEAVRDSFNSVFGVYENGASKFQSHMDAMAEALRKGDEKVFAELAARLTARWAEDSHKLGFGVSRQRTQLDPRDQAFERKNAQLSERENSYYQRQFNDFTSSTVNLIASGVNQRIQGAVDKALEGQKISDGAKKRLVGEIHTKIDEIVRSDSAHRTQINQLMNVSPRGNLSQYRMDEGTKRQIVNLAVSRAMRALPQVAKQVISEWTTDVIGTSKSTAARARAAAARPDITGSVPSNFAGKKPLSKDDAKKMSDADILNYDGPIA